ncbi:hypothetical protein RB595_007282 [Gaeumannomyces hyphopodioides]
MAEQPAAQTRTPRAPGDDGSLDPAAAGPEQASKPRGPSVQADGAASTDVWDPELERAFEAYVPGTEEERRLVRKIDLLLLPTLWWMYVLAQIDRSNIANANAAGLSQDLGLSDDDYALVVSIFFVGYAIMEVPSNLVLNRWRPSLYLTTIMGVWGACVAAMSTAGSRGHFLVGRFFLGCIEAGMYPGALFILTCWYKKDEVGKRFCVFATSGTLSQALGGIMAGGIIAGMDGKNGWPGWRWLFLVEGVATVFFAFVFIFVLPDYPLGTRRFTPAERRLAHVRMLVDRRASTKTGEARLTALESVLAVAADPRTYAFLVIYILNTTAMTISYFIPATLRTMGYTQVTAQWMTVPIWVSASVAMLTISYFSDRTGDRRWCVAGCMAAAAACCGVCLGTDAGAARYAMLCLLAGALWTATPQILTWASELLALPDQKRSVALALINSFGTLSVLWGSRLWPSAESPAHRTGFSAVAAMSAAGALTAALMPLAFARLSTAPRTAAEARVLGLDGAPPPEVLSSSSVDASSVDTPDVDASRGKGGAGA